VSLRNDNIVQQKEEKYIVRKEKDDFDLNDGGKVQSRASRKKSSSSRSKSRTVLYETPNTRKMKRRIQMDWIGTIEEGMLSDEEEI
jgi:hypothetical protein